MKYPIYSAIISVILALAMPFPSLLAGYAWAEGRHANESQVNWHHLLEQLAPDVHHHPVGLVVGEESQGLEGYGQGSNAIIISTAAMIAAPIMVAATPLVSVSYVYGTAALPTATTSFIVLSSLLMLLWVYLMRPQHQPPLLGKPPMSSS